MDATDRAPLVEPLDEQVDHVRGEAGAHVIVEYGDYECPYSRQAFRAIEQVEAQRGRVLRFAFRHFPPGSRWSRTSKGDNRGTVSDWDDVPASWSSRGVNHALAAS